MGLTRRQTTSILSPHAEPFETVFNSGAQQAGPLGPQRQPRPAPSGFGPWSPGKGSNPAVPAGPQGTNRRGGTPAPGGIFPGAVDPNRATRTPGYRTYSGSGPWTGTPAPGTGFESKEARDAAKNAGKDPYGSESGNTYLEDRYLQRLYGEDPAFNYAAKRGMEGIGNRFSAAGGFNSGAARQQESDFLANLTAQSQGQLDALAGGATGARQNKTDSMYRTMLGMAGGQSGINTAYDLKAGDAMSDALSALLGYTTGKAGVDDKSRQSGFNNLMALYSAS